MSFSSDSEDEKLKLILEAADTNFLVDSMFNRKVQAELQPVGEHPKSQRNLQDADHSCVDFIPPETVQKLMSNKLASLVQEQIEFITEADANNTANKWPKRKSRLRLLNDFECYVKPYEDFEFEKVGIQIKPTIKRRAVDKDNLNEKDKVRCVAVDGDKIFSGDETKNWSMRSKGKVFCYKLGGGSSKVQHLIESENEFSKLRRKNKWNEAKIKNKFSTK